MKNRRNVSNKTVAILLALVLAIGCAVGGTLAWLISKTKPVVNTFTYGDINIDLYEHEYNASENKLGKSEVPKVDNYKIIPGVDLPKDPTVEVKANSEACWLFVKVEEQGTFVADKVTYGIADGWRKGDGKGIPQNVYYREVGAVTDDTPFNVLKDNQVIVSDTLTKEDIKGITPNPTLTFTAYAVQKDGIADATTAWAKIPTTTNP